MAVAMPAGIAPRAASGGRVGPRLGGVAPGCRPSRTGLDALVRRRLVRRRRRGRARSDRARMEGTIHPYLHGTTAGARCSTRRGRPPSSRPRRRTSSRWSATPPAAYAVLANELAAGHDGDGLDVRLAVPIAPVTDLPVAMAQLARGQAQAGLSGAGGGDVAGGRPVDVRRS